MKSMPRDPADRTVRHDPEPVTFLKGTSRSTMAFAAVFLGLLAGWMIWIIHTYTGGNRSFDLVVSLFFDELILAVAAFAVLLFTWAVFAPPWVGRLLTKAHRKVTWAIGFVGILFAAAILIVVFVLPMLERLGIIS